MTDAPNVSDTFHRPCLDCGIAVETVGSITRGHVCTPNEATLARAYWHGYDRAQAEIAARQERES